MSQSVDIPTMDQAITLVRNFIATEYDALVAFYTEPDEEPFIRRRQLVETFLGEDVDSGLVRPEPPPALWIERGHGRVGTGDLVPRRLFQVKAYRHPRFGMLYRAYVSTNERSVTEHADYMATLFIAQTEGLKIVSRYDLDILPQEGERIADGALSWIFHSGLKITTMGELQEVRKFEPPDDPQQRREYESE